MLARQHEILPRGKGFQWRFQSATSGIVKALWSTGQSALRNEPNFLDSRLSRTTAGLF
jgi:hypothetical protein